MPVSDGFRQAVNEAYKKAIAEFENADKSLPMGFAKLENFDGRTAEANFFKQDKRFTFRKNNSTHIKAPKGSTVSIDRIGGQHLERKKQAYRVFLNEMQERGYLHDISVHSRLD